MAKKIIGLFKKAYTKLFRKKTRRTIWGQKFGYKSDFYSDSYFSHSSREDVI